MTELVLTIERTIDAPPKEVFNAWLDPETLRKFMMPGPGMHVPSARTDPRPGGSFEIIMHTGETEIRHTGTYLEIVPYDRIVFTWENTFSVEGSTVTLTFAPDGSGTHLALTHRRFENEEVRDNHRNGWTGILQTLSAQFS